MSRLLTVGKPSCEVLCQRTYGCTVAEYWAIRGPGPYRRSPVEKFVSQRKAAEQRGIDWEFDLLSWWKVWQDSGLWDERTKKSGYVMSRPGDIGPYSPSNVHICLANENCRENIVRINSRRRDNIFFAQKRS